MTSGDSLRLFVGLPLPQSYQEALGCVQSKWGPVLRSRLSWTKVGNWHLTLRFLGNVPLPMVESVQEALGRVRLPTFPFQAGGGGFFPSLRRPRVAWIGIGPGRDNCVELAEIIAVELRSLRYAPVKDRFSPHLTIARIREDRGDPWELLKQDMDGLQLPEFCMERFILWKSDLSPKGPTYTPISEYSLAVAYG
jgi:RNA 2',3'-cyclic 3'-phosphodiesterase